MSEAQPIPLILNTEGLARHEDLACPYDCGYTLNALAGLSHPGTVPEPGDVALCGGCGRFLEWTAHGYAPLSDAARQQMIREQPDDWATLVMVQAQTRVYRGLPPLEPPAAGEGG